MSLAAPVSRLVKFLPVVGRELRVAARGKAAHRWRLTAAAVGLALMAGLTVGLSAERVPAEMQGQVLFRVLIWVSALYGLLAGASLMSDSISREKREGTLGLLFLTDLRGVDIVLGKLAANSVNLVYGLLGLVPLLAVPVMLGGVSIEMGVLAGLTVLNILFGSLTVSVLVSALNWDERRASFYSVCGALAFLFGPYLLGEGAELFLGLGSWISEILSPLSPFEVLRVLSSGFGGGRAWAVAQRLVPSHVLGWVFLFLACRVVTRAWHHRGGTPVRRTVDERVFTSRNPVARAANRRRQLDAHPLVWLLERHPAKRFYADGLVAAILAIWGWGYWRHGTEMFGGPSWFLIMPLGFAVHIILASWVVAESSVRWIEDRRSGALELLLCTSLTDRDLVRGHRLALRRLFLRPVLALAATEVVIAWMGFAEESDAAATNGRVLMMGMAAALLLDTQALSWIGLRLALGIQTVNRVSGLALAITPIGPLLLTGVCTAFWYFLLPVGRRPTFVTGVLVWIGMVAAVNVLIGQTWCRRSVLRELRDSAARQPPKVTVT